MFQKIFCGLALLLATASANAVAANSVKPPRVSALYCTWDNYYFYAGFQVSDSKVIGTNTSPTSHPQDDDDVELFINTERGDSQVRTSHTYQMAVSCANGAYFSVGQGTLVPKPKVVYTYKYAVGVDGTLNDNTDTDVGYTVEVAIPWTELGRSGPPVDGTVWGFNAISRNRDSLTSPSTEFYSLSAKVQSEADVQNPSKWSTLLFTTADSVTNTSTEEQIVCPKVTQIIPEIDGKIASGEWPDRNRESFGTIPIQAPAPTVAEEPNVTEEQFENASLGSAPQKVVTIIPHNTGDVVSDANRIELPGGGSIKIVPGGVKDPAGFNPSPVDSNGRHVNPLTENIKRVASDSDVGISLTGSLALTPPAPSRLIFGLYRLDYSIDNPRNLPTGFWGNDGKQAAIDLPSGGAGPWVNGQNLHWQIRQLSGLRKAGIDVALIRVYSTDTKIYQELDCLVSALRSLRAAGEDYPLVSIAVATSKIDLNSLYSRIPPEFRAVALDHPADVPHVLVYKMASDIELPGALADATPIDDLVEGPEVAVVSALQRDAAGKSLGATQPEYERSWTAATLKNPTYVVVDSWNDYVAGDEIAPSESSNAGLLAATRLAINTFNGSHQWHAKYLTAAIPQVLRTKQLYQIPVRVLNAGTVAWKATQDYSLCTRWYRDGRLFDDSAPRIPLGTDVLPGQAVTIGVGVTPVNGYGDDLKPGEYTLVFDVVQGDDRWFSYASDIPLQSVVRVAAGNADEAASKVTFLGTTTSNPWTQFSPLETNVSFRNDSTYTWNLNQQELDYKLYAGSSDSFATPISSGTGAKLIKDVLPGDVVTLTATVPPLTGSVSATPDVMIHWYLKANTNSLPVLGEYDEGVTVTKPEVVPDILLAQLPETIRTGKQASARVTIRNGGTEPWLPSTVAMVYQWYDSDGRPVVMNDCVPKPIDSLVQPGDVIPALKINVQAPNSPGNYTIEFSTVGPNNETINRSSLPGSGHLFRMKVAVANK